MARIGIDLGGTKILGVVVKDGKVRRDAKCDTPTEGGPEAVIDAVLTVVGDLGGTAAATAVGVGAPGVVDAATGVVGRAPNLPGWDRPVDLGPRLESALGMPVRVDNDVNAGTLAEHRLGAGRGARDLLGLFVGTGVGGGLVLDGRLRRGARGLAGEIGHTIVYPGGRRCGCGLDGHLEAYAGRAGLEREARRLHAAGEETLLVELAGEKRMKSSIFAKALDARDRVARELLDEAVTALGFALASAVAVVDLERVVVGGGMADRLGAGFVERIAEAAGRSSISPVPLDVVPGELGDHGGALGAALLVDE